MELYTPFFWELPSSQMLGSTSKEFVTIYSQSDFLKMCIQHNASQRCRLRFHHGDSSHKIFSSLEWDGSAPNAYLGRCQNVYAKKLVHYIGFFPPLRLAVNVPTEHVELNRELPDNFATLREVVDENLLIATIPRQVLHFVHSKNEAP